jgi:hypothetical protein
MATLTMEQMDVVNESDACCEGCGADPRAAAALDGWFIDSILTPDGDRVAQIRCPACW